MQTAELPTDCYATSKRFLKCCSTTLSHRARPSSSNMNLNTVCAHVPEAGYLNGALYRLIGQPNYRCTRCEIFYVSAQP